MKGWGLWEWLEGYVEIAVEGGAIESFINLATGEGIRFFNLNRQKEQLLFACTPVRGFSRLRHLARRTRCRVRIRRRHGLPFFLFRFRQRRFLVAGVVGGIMLLYFLSSLVWVIQVEGAVRNNPQAVLERANQLGLRVGVPRWWINWGKVERGLKSSFPDIAFLGIEAQGTQVTLRVVEKVLPPAGNGAALPLHLVAARDGVIKEILVIAGEPQVRPGDVVKRGQILISGIVPPPGSGSRVPLPGVVIPPPRNTEPELVRARGIVKALVWYQAYGESPLVEESWEKTGQGIHRLAVRLKDREFVVGRKEVPYANYQVELKKEWWLPFFTGSGRGEAKGEEAEKGFLLRWEKVEELYPYRREYSLEEAQQRAVEQARAQIEKERLPGSRLVSEQVKLLPLQADNWVRVQVVIETEEDIGEQFPAG